MFGKAKKGRTSASKVFKRLNENEKTPLIRSIERIRPRDIKLSEGAKVQKSTYRLILGAVRYALLTASSLMFLLSCVALVLYVLSYIQTSEENAQYSEVFYGDATLSAVSVATPSRANVETLEFSRSLAGEVIDVEYSEGVYNEEFQRMRSKILDMKRQNPDVWGWITVENTNIDYPIMFSGDNSFYLTHSPNKKTNSHGSIFADGRTKPKLEDNKALIVYGHNMNATNTMFAQLIHFTKEDVFNNRRITITTLEGIYTFEVFSIYNTTADYNYIRTQFYGDSDFLQFVNKCDSLSLFHKDVEFTEDDMLLTLSTCTTQRDDKRWAIHAKLIAVSN